MAMNRELLKSVVLYVCRTVRNPDKLGKVKLHKVLWFAETQAMIRTASPITGVEFIKHEHGPFAPVLESIVQELQAEGRLSVRSVPYLGFEKTEYVAKVDANVSELTDKQLRLIDSVIQSVCDDHTATSISDRSHQEIWEMAAMYEPLPVETALVSRLLPITDEDLAWARDEYTQLNAR